MLSTKQQEVITLIQRDKSYENYFFKKVSEPKLFFPLKDIGYFKAENAPKTILLEEEGLYSIPEWNVLQYLERISKQTQIDGYKTYIDEIFNIIKAVTETRKDNYRTWWYFVKILCNIPNNLIPEEIIGLIPIWLDSRFRSSAQGAEITTKLLPKFLSESSTPEDIKKAESIINYITQLKPSAKYTAQESMWISVRDRYDLVVDSYWLKTALEKHSETIGQKCSRKVIDDLSSKIKKLSGKDKSPIYLDLDHERSHIVELSEEGNFYLVKVGIVAERSETLFDVDEKIESIKEKKIKKGDESDFIEKISAYLINFCASYDNNPDELKAKTYHLYRNLYDSGTYKSFYEKSDYPLRDSFELLTDALKNILLAKSKVDRKITNEILNEFLSDRYLYFTKMGLFIIAHDMDKYGVLIRKFINEGNTTFISEGHYFGDELKHVLEGMKFKNDKDRYKLKTIIEKGPKYFVPNWADENYLSRWKQKRYRALRHDSFFEKLYEDLKKKTNSEPELSAAIGPMITRWGPGKSHLTKDQILEMSNANLAGFLSGAKTEGFWEEPTVGGLADTLKIAVKEQPEKFINDLTPFSKTGYLYIYEMLWGIKDAWKNKQAIDWGKLLKFIIRYTEKEAFWNDSYMVVGDRWEATHEWVVREIADLLHDGTRNDKWAIDAKYLSKIENLLLFMVDKTMLPRKEDEEINAPVTHALNSINGKLFSALISFALRTARLESKVNATKRVKWKREIKERFERALEHNIIEAYTLFGQYIRNLNYLDSRWVNKKIKDFESLKDERMWNFFMYGYLFMSEWHPKLYKKMEGHFEKAIESGVKGETSQERLIQHITIGYLAGIEEISGDGLFGKIIYNWNPSEIREVINYFWTQHNILAKPVLPKQKRAKKNIIQFWRMSYDRYKGEEDLGDDDKAIISELSRLIAFLDEIDSESFKWLKLSVQHIHINFNSPFFIEKINRIKDRGESKKFIGELFLEMLNNFTPDFDQKHIRSIIEYLLESGDEKIKEEAKTICISYGKRGFDFLRDIYEKHK